MSVIDYGIREPRAARKQHVCECDPNVIIGPVCSADVWRGSRDNPVRSGWGFEIYTRIDGIVGSFIPRVAWSERTAARWRREIIEDCLAAGAGRVDRATVHDCASDVA